jgi:hypothetical protein
VDDVQKNNLCGFGATCGEFPLARLPITWNHVRLPGRSVAIRNARKTASTRDDGWIGQCPPDGAGRGVRKAIVCRASLTER